MNLPSILRAFASSRRPPAASCLLALCCCLALHAGEPRFRAEIQGEVLHANTLDLGPVQFRDVVAVPKYAGTQLSFLDCRATGYGGTLDAGLRIDVEQSRFTGKAQVNDLDLGTILRSFGSRVDNVGGTLNGWVEFDTPAGKPKELTGTGDLSITKASLVPMPIFARLLLGDPSGRKNEDRADARFELRDGALRIIWARIETPSATIAISGTIAFDGELNLNLATDLKAWWGGRSIPGLRELLGGVVGIFSRLARWRIRGHITQPELVLNPFGNSAGL